MNRIDQLIDKGVRIPNPASVELGQEVEIDRISGENVSIFSGCKIYGSKTFISQGAQIGAEGPATVENCYLGPDAELKAGFFQEAAFLASSSCGTGAHVRRGTILEEHASIAHTVGLKQTILFPYVTLGSLINFCDCLMAGGRSREDHSEVGSSYIHFNYTPNQDKATPSIMGDVPRGVMLNQSPIFLGGQGGLVGPCRLAYGTIVAAGSICRKDQMEENHLVIETPPRSARVPFTPGGFHNLNRVIAHNMNYIGSLYALKQWYRVIRGMFVGAQFPEPLLDGLMATLALGIDERIKQLKRLKDKVQVNLSGGSAGPTEQAFCRNWASIESALGDLQSHEGNAGAMDRFAGIVEEQIRFTGKHYLACIEALTPDQAEIGTQWQQSIVDQLAHHPSTQIQ